MRWAHHTLDTLGISPDLQRAVIGEITRCKGTSWCADALELDDLLAIGITTLWTTLQERPDARGGLIRLRVRWAVQEALRKEAYAHGLTKADRHREQHPRAERHCQCGKSLGTLASAGARCCTRCQWRVAANRSKRYRERKKIV